MNEVELKELQKKIWHEKMLNKYGSPEAVAEEMKRRRGLVNPRNIKGRPPEKRDVLE